MNRKSITLIILLAFVLIIPTLALLPGTVKADYPSGPTGLSATPGDGQVFLSWNECSGSFDGYHVEINGHIHAWTANTWEDAEYYPSYPTPLTNGVTYTFRVWVLYDGHSDSDRSYSNEVTMAPRAPTAPDAPSITSSSASGNGQVYLAWTTPSNGGASIQGYKVYVDDDLRTTTGSNSITISSLIKTQSYDFSVAAYNSVGTSDKSSEVHVTVHGVPDAPTGLGVTPSNGKVSLSWTAPINNGGLSIDYYVVYRDGTDINHVSTGTSYNATGLTNDQSYSFTVAAHNSDGVGAQTSASSSTPYTVPDMPTGMTAIAGNHLVSLNWTAPALNGGNMIGYYVVYQDGVDIFHVVSGTSYTVNELTNLLSYRFNVTAHNAAGNGQNSSSVDAVPFNPPSVTISAPADDSYNSTGSVRVTWIGTDHDGSGLAYFNFSVLHEDVWDNTSNMGPSSTNVLMGAIEDGEYTVHVEVVDNATHRSTASVTFIVDMVSPSLVIDSPTVSSYNTTGHVLVRWTTSDTTSGIAKTEISTDGTSWDIVSGTTHELTLEDGPRTAYVKVTDHAGNYRQSSVGFYVDTVAPNVNIVSPADNSYNTTTSVLVTWTGSDDGSGLAYYNFSLKYGTSWANTTDIVPSETSILLNALSDGNYTAYVSAVDVAGNSQVASVRFIVDTVRPSLVISSPTANSYNTTGHVLVRWTTSDATSGIAKTEISTDGTIWSTITGTADTLTLEDGSWTAYVKVTDHAGNFNQSSVSFFVDTVAPTLSIASPADNSYNDTGSVVVSWNSNDDGSGLAYFDFSLFNGAIWVNTTHIASSELTKTLNPIADGNYTAYVSAVDVAGNSQVASVRFIVDRVSPSLAINSPTANSYNTTGQVTIRWTTSDITSGIAKTEISTDGTIWSTITGTADTLTLEDGSWTAYVKVTDHAGNFKQSSVSFHIDTITPSLDIVSPAGNSYNNTGSVNVTWTASDTGSGMSYSEVKIDNDGWTNVSSALTHTFGSLGEGSHTVTVHAVDVAGNTETQSVSFTVSFGLTYSISSPVTIVSPSVSASPYYTKNPTVTISGTSSDTAPIASANWTYYHNGIAAQYGSISDLSGLYDFSGAYDLQEGNNTLVLTVNDSASNTVTIRMTVVYSTGPVLDHPASPIYTRQNAVDLAIGGTDWAPMTDGNVTHYLNGSWLESYIVDGMVADKTSFSEIMTFHLLQGTNLFVVLVNDSAGNSVSFNLTVIYDTIAPPIQIISPSDGMYDNTGIVTVTWTDLDNDFGSGIAYFWLSIDGNDWTNLSLDTSCLYDALTDGPHSVIVNAFDNAGNNVTKEVGFTVSFGPSITTSPASTVYTNQSKYNVTIGAADFAPLTTGNVSHYVNGVLSDRYLIDDLVAGQTAFDQPVSFLLDQGTNVFVITLNDSAGNPVTFGLTFVFDTTIPVVNIVLPGPDMWYNTTELNITWTASDVIGLEHYYWISMDGGQFVNVTDGYCIFQDLADGHHVVGIRSFDLVGNNNYTVRAFNIETTGLVLSMLSPTSGDRSNKSIVTVNWNASAPSGIAGYNVSVDGGVWTDEAMSTSRTFTLADGTHTVSIKVQDLAGNWDIAEVRFVVDTTAPTITAHTPEGNEVALAVAVNITFSEEMNTSSVSITINGTTGTISWNNNTATFTPSSALVSNTMFEVIVSGSDLAGNAVSDQWSFTTTNHGVIEGVIKDSDGNPIANALVTLSNGMNATTDSNGHFVITGVSPGTYNLTVTRDGYQTMTGSVTATAGLSSGIGAMGTMETSVRPNDGTMIGIIVIVLFLAVMIGLTYVQWKKE